MQRQVTVITPENAEISYELAGVGSRMVAGILDTIFQFLVAAAIALPFLLASAFGMISGGLISHLSGWAAALAVVGVFLLMWGYYLVYEGIRNGQTPGKRILRIRVVRDTGQPIDLSCAAVRNLVRWLDFLPAGYSVGILSIMLSPTYRRIGDYAAGTMVVKERIGEAPNRPAQPEVPDGRAYSGDISGLLKEDKEAIARFVERRRELDSSVQADIAKRLCSTMNGRVDIDASVPLDCVAFLESLYERLVEEQRYDPRTVSVAGDTFDDEEP